MREVSNNVCSLQSKMSIEAFTKVLDKCNDILKALFSTIPLEKVNPPPPLESS